MRLSFTADKSAPAARPATSTTSRVINVAHRGASDRAAENTLAAVRAGIELGADLVEVDVQRTKDGVLVLMHDATLARTTNAREVFPDRRPWHVGDFTYAELLRLDAGAWKTPECAGQPIPTLAETIEVLRGSDVGLLLELKGVALHPGLVTDVVATMRSVPGYLESAVGAHRLVVQSFDFAAMKHLKAVEPSLSIGLIGKPARAQLPALATWADQINPNHYAVDSSYVAAVQRLGMQCLMWTVDHPRSMRRALRMGVDGVITNRPDALHRELLNHRAGSVPS